MPTWACAPSHAPSAAPTLRMPSWRPAAPNPAPGEARRQAFAGHSCCRGCKLSGLVPSSGRALDLRAVQATEGVKTSEH